jgi:hypothetical protein
MNVGAPRKPAVDGQIGASIKEGKILQKVARSNAYCAARYNVKQGFIRSIRGNSIADYTEPGCLSGPRQRNAS